MIRQASDVIAEGTRIFAEGAEKSLNKAFSHVYEEGVQNGMKLEQPNVRNTVTMEYHQEVVKQMAVSRDQRLSELEHLNHNQRLTIQAYQKKEELIAQVLVTGDVSTPAQQCEANQDKLYGSGSGSLCPPYR